MATNEQVIERINKLEEGLIERIEKVDEKAIKNDEAIRGNGDAGLKAQVAEAVGEYKKNSSSVKGSSAKGSQVSRQ